MTVSNSLPFFSFKNFKTEISASFIFQKTLNLEHGFIEISCFQFSSLLVQSHQFEFLIGPVSYPEIICFVHLEK